MHMLRKTTCLSAKLWFYSEILWQYFYQSFTESTVRQLVPILFTEETVEAIKVIVKNRSKCGISAENIYLFACGVSGFRLRGWDTLQQLTKKIDLEKPKLLTPTRTRKHVATMMQLLDMTDGELTWLTSHMGHTNDVHRNWYRKEDTTIELTKVARALMSVDCGSRKDLQNKKIDELQISGTFFSW